MKLFNKYFTGFITATMTLVIVSGCVKRESYLFPVDYDLSKTSQVQLYLAAVNASRNYVYVDAVPLNGTAISSGGVFPSGAGTVASAISSGLKAFLVRDTLTATTQVPLSFAENMQPGSSYTIFMYDTITSPKQKTVNTNIVVPADTTARLRFANFVYNPTVLPDGFDIFSKKRNAVIFTNVRQTEVTDFIPYASNVTDTFYIRPTGTTTNLQNWRTTAPAAFIDLIGILTPTPKRSYTLVFRGGFRATATSNTTVRTLSTFVNY